MTLVEGPSVGAQARMLLVRLLLVALPAAIGLGTRAIPEIAIGQRPLDVLVFAGSVLLVYLVLLTLPLDARSARAAHHARFFGDEGVAWSGVLLWPRGRLRGSLHVRGDQVRFVRARGAVVMGPELGVRVVAVEETAPSTGWTWLTAGPDEAHLVFSDGNAVRFATCEAEKLADALRAEIARAKESDRCA